MIKQLFLFALAAAGTAGLTSTQAAGLPDKQPNLLYIWRESVKPGRAAEHAKNEAGFVAALEKSKSTGYGVALISDTGPNEAWYLSTWESNAAFGEDRKRVDKDPGASAELSRLDRIDAEYVSSVRRIMARGRPELSVGEFPDLSKVRFYQITEYRVRSGHEEQFEEAAKTYTAAMKRAETKIGARVYQVEAGMHSPSFLVFSSLEDYAGYDQLAKDAAAAWEAATAEEKATIRNAMREAVAEEETNRFTVDPLQSFVPKETRAKDPEFWSPK